MPRSKSARRPSARSGRPPASRNSTSRPRRWSPRGWGSAIRTTYNGTVYASKAEAAYARYLDLAVKAGRVKEWEGQYRWPLIVNGEKVCTMVPDFRVALPDGTMELVEVKGYPTAIWRLKRKLFEALHPKVAYRVVTAREALGL